MSELPLRWQEANLSFRSAIKANAVPLPFPASVGIRLNFLETLVIMEGDVGPIVVRH
jgi:hypothetical protein